MIASTLSWKETGDIGFISDRLPLPKNGEGYGLGRGARWRGRGTKKDLFLMAGGGFGFALARAVRHFGLLSVALQCELHCVHSEAGLSQT